MLQLVVFWHIYAKVLGLCPYSLLSVEAVFVMWYPYLVNNDKYVNSILFFFFFFCNSDASDFICGIYTSSIHAHQIFSVYDIYSKFGGHICS